MSAITNLSKLLRSYSNKQGSAFINLRDFCEYIKKYAEHYVEEEADLVKYLGNSTDTIVSEIQKLKEKNIACLIDHGEGKKIIVLLSYFTMKAAQRFKDISYNSSVSFPTTTDLPKLFPLDALEKMEAQDLLSKLLKNQDLKSPKLYIMQLSNDVPPILFPECVPINVLTSAAFAKMRTMLKKEEYHDYFYKKLRISNPGKEISTKSFFEQFVMRPEAALQSLESSSDSFYFWSQLCYFIKKDFEKVKDTTIEDTNILQAVSISELHLMLLKNNVQQQQQKNDALKLLETSLAKPPYFYSMNAILKFTDNKGIPLHGRYSDEDLQNHLEMLTSKNDDGKLPYLLVFKVESGTRYFVYKTKVFPLIIRLCNEAHDIIQKNLTEEWHRALKNYERLPEMRDKQKFELALKKQIEKVSPILYALLTSNFLTVLDVELRHGVDGGDFKLFSDGELLPYSDLLMIKSSTVFNNAKILLPFWYLIPIVSHIIGFFNKKPQTAKVVEKENVDEIPHTSKPTTKREALAQAAMNIEKNIIPEGSTIDRELDAYCKQWNKMISKESSARLTEDVNSLIRDYMRRVVRTISSQTFTIDRVQSLAESLVKTPNMQKITEQEALYMYVQLYILRLVKNV